LPDGLPPDVLLFGGAMLRSAQIAGALQGALELTRCYATQRVQFGRPIGSFQAIQHQIAVMAEHTASALIGAEAAFAAAGSTLPDFPIMAAKVCAGEAASVGAAIAHAVHGAIGFTYEHSLHLMTRRLWSWRSEYGSQSYWAQRLGTLVCASGASSLWPAVTCPYPATP
jgi:acyl-CoA dehydrogenase